jgi:hypothetical protein
MNATKLIVVGISFAAAVLAADPWAGTWKMRSSPQSKLASRTITESETGPDSFHVVFDDVSKAGEKSKHDEVLNCDGKDHMQKGASSTAICTRTGPTTRTLASKKDGKIVDQVTHSLSADGKVLTVTNTSTGNVVVYDKQ